MRFTRLMMVSSIVAAVMSASMCYAAPSCCDPGENSKAPEVFAPSPQMLQAVPMAPADVRNARPQPARAAAPGPRIRWTVPAAAAAPVQTNRFASGKAQVVQSCCAQPKPRSVPRQAGCCGGFAPRAVPQQAGCCGKFTGTVAPAPASCCGQAQACPGYAGQQVRQTPRFSPAARSCCSPAKASSRSFPGVGYVPVATPGVTRLGYTVPIQAEQVGQVPPTTFRAVSSPMNPTIRVERASSSYSYGQPRNLW